MSGYPVEEVRDGIRQAMKEGGVIALDSGIRLLGRLVQTFTVSGRPQEAMGASAAMEMMKQLRDSAPDLFAANATPDDRAKPKC